jgi:hypothetical protein
MAEAMSDNFALTMDAMKSGQILRWEFCLQRPSVVKPDFYESELECRHS